jgi:uncharacterized repeat protein (TIGR01451 family)
MDASKISKSVRFILAVSIGLALVMMIFLGQAHLARAAGPARSAPNDLTAHTLLGGSTITATKTVNRENVYPGDTLAYTIVFTTDMAGTVVITDKVPAGLVLATSTVTGTPAGSILVDIDNGTIKWTATAAANSPVSLVFAAQVGAAIEDDTITNIAWLSQTTDYVATNQVSSSVALTREIYLPITHKQEYTYLSIRSTNTGNFVVNIRSLADNSIVSTCNVANNTTSSCAVSFAPGTYLVEVNGTACGSTQVQRTFPAGEVTLPISCN